VMQPKNGKADWEITLDIAKAMGFPMHCDHPSEIMDEIARLTPTFASVSFAKLDELGSVQWPCNAIPERLRHSSEPALRARSGNRPLFPRRELTDLTLFGFGRAARGGLTPSRRDALRGISTGPRTRLAGSDALRQRTPTRQSRRPRSRMRGHPQAEARGSARRLRDSLCGTRRGGRVTAGPASVGITVRYARMPERRTASHDGAADSVRSAPA
jgi:hypothetical protein